ncbi:indoleamine 2,3-dioxygenase 2-like [Asterias amurensis]|uniref:indoleamine 2,3-dioxygenase 2-like n=1 Tax=Asterias amurensis TaxID=7602 RepID=UPI003AB5527A
MEMEICKEDAALLNLQNEVPRLEDYDASQKLGFLYENITNKLPEYFDPWWNIATRLQELVDDGTLRDKVDMMPCLDCRRLESEGEWQVAHAVLGYITQCYVWAEGETRIPQCLPENVAVPYWAVSEHLGINASLCQASSVLYNWELIDPSGPLIIENMKVIIPFVGGQDSAWFFLVSSLVEMEFGGGLAGLVKAQQAVKDLNTDEYIAALVEVKESLRKMRKALLRMRERCRPSVFYNMLRPFLAGWNSQAFKDKGWKGLIYKGVSPEPVSSGGGSAAQSSTFPCLDAALGLKHQPQDETQCAKFARDMPPLHRDLIKALAMGPSIRHFATICNNSRALQAYKDCLTAVIEFRSAHIQIATEYIIVMSHRKDNDEKHSKQAAYGTGGTGIMKFLKGLRSTVKTAFHLVDEGTEIN